MTLLITQIAELSTFDQVRGGSPLVREWAATTPRWRRRIAIRLEGQPYHAATFQACTPGVPGWISQMRDNGGVTVAARVRRSSVTFYGPDHVRARVAAVARYRIGDRCAIGGEPLTVPASRLDLAHDHVRGGYLGLACRRHNRGEGASRGNAARGPLPRAQRKAIAYKQRRWQ